MRRRYATEPTTIRAVPDVRAEQEFHRHGELLIGLARLWLKDPAIPRDLISRAYEAGAALHFLAQAIHHEAYRRILETLPNPP